MKLIIAGGRDFNNYDLLKTKLDYLLSKTTDNVIIVSGCAKGADKLGEQYAIERGYECTLFPADWDTHGKKAGYLRNKQMAEHGTHCVLFWDGKSKGTAIMKELAEEYGLKLVVVKY